MAEPLSNNMDWELAKNKWPGAINPVLSLSINQGRMITKTLNLGDTTMNHGLGRKQVGWMISDITGPATIYRSEPLNGTTLTLTSDAVVTVSIWVF